MIRTIHILWARSTIAAFVQVQSCNTGKYRDQDLHSKQIVGHNIELLTSHCLRFQVQKAPERSHPKKEYAGILYSLAKVKTGDFGRYAQFSLTYGRMWLLA
jgi:hypothetical protein